MDLYSQLAERLSARRPVEIKDPEATACAVLVPVIATGPDSHGLVYTLRSEDVPNHQGQVSFPGGKLSPADGDLLETALRETREEIGLDTNGVDVLGRLDDVPTYADSFVITPYVAALPPDSVFKPNPREVSRLFTVDLDNLRDPANRRVEMTEWEGEQHELHSILAAEQVIWGATHRITLDLLACLD